MLDAIFYLIVILCVFAGYKKGAVESGYYFISNGMAAYFSVWLLPFLLQIVQYVPGVVREYALPLLLVAVFSLISFGVKYGIDKLIEEYPAMSSVPVISGMPVVNKVFGVIFGICMGCAVAPFLLFTVSFAPYDIASFVGGDFAESADARVLAFSKRVNKVSDSSWDLRQEEFLKEVAAKHRGKVKISDESDEKPDDKSDKKAEEKTAPAEPVSAPEAPAYAAEGTVINRIAGKAVSAVSANQARALREADGLPAGRERAAERVSRTAETPAAPAPQSKREAAIFTLTVPLLKADGNPTQFKRELKLGIV
ncbi:MAG: CvpA family protein, partial [Lentisphaeria bacterium]|nr:CvpA family protein [Lentisphaeria bacterium]